MGRQAGGTFVQRSWIEATVIRADGTVEHLGVISDSGPTKRRTFFQRMRALLWPN